MGYGSTCFNVQSPTVMGHLRLVVMCAWGEGRHPKQHHRLDEEETKSLVTGSRYRADQWACFKATRNPTRNPRVDTTNNNPHWTKKKQSHSSLVRDTGLTNGHPSKRHAARHATLGSTPQTTAPIGRRRNKVTRHWFAIQG
jgi:hypothetical protein